MAARAAVVRREDRPPSLQPIAEARQERRLPLIGRAPVEPAQQPAGGPSSTACQRHQRHRGSRCGRGGRTRCHRRRSTTRPARARPRPAPSKPSTGPTAMVRRAHASPTAYVTICVGVRAPVRNATIVSPTHDSWPCTPRATSCPAPVGRSTMTRRPNPDSFRHSATLLPSGDTAKERWPAPHVGPPCSCGSSSTGRPSRWSVSHPVASERWNNAPSRPKRGCCICNEMPPYAVSTPTVLPRRARAIRLSSHAMFGQSHSCHATVVQSGLHAGSVQKSAPVDSRRGGTSRPGAAGSERRAPDLGHLHRVGDPPAVRGHGRRLQRTIGITRRGDDDAGRPADDVLPPQAPVTRRRRRTRCCPGTSRSTHRRAPDRGGVAVRT